MILFTNNIQENKISKKVYLSESALQIIAEAVLSLSDIWEKYYSKIPYEEFTKIVSSDPTTVDDKMGKYSKWLLNLYLKQQLKLEDLYKAKECLTLYTKFINRIEQKDINKIPNLVELYNIVEPFEQNPDQATSGKDEVRRTKEEATKVYEDDEWLVVVPKTKEAACYYGKGTKWCTAASEDNYKHNMFDAYSKAAPLYININKQSGRKYQFQFNGDDSQFMDERDHEIQKPIPQTIGMSEGLINFYYDFGSEDDINDWFNKLYFDTRWDIEDIDGEEWEDRFVGITWDSNYGIIYGGNGVEYEQLTEPFNLDFAIDNGYNQIKLGNSDEKYGFVAWNGLLPLEKNSGMDIGLFDVETGKFIVPFDEACPNIGVSNKYIYLVGQSVIAVNVETKQITFNQELMKGRLIGRKRHLSDIFFPLSDDGDIAISYTYGKEGGYVLINMATNKIISKDIIDPTYYSTKGEWFFTNDVKGNDIKINIYTGKIEKI